VVGRLRHLDDAADVDDGLALGDQLLGGLELADDLLRRVPGAFHGRVPGPVWPDEDSHSPWTDLRGPRQYDHTVGQFIDKYLLGKAQQGSSKTICSVSLKNVISYKALPVSTVQHAATTVHVYYSLRLTGGSTAEAL